MMKVAVLRSLPIILVLSHSLAQAMPFPLVPLPPLQYPPSISQMQFSNSKTGAYFYYYDTGNDGASSFRGERREMSGDVSGYFGYIDPDGVLRITHYTADIHGYRSATTLRYLQAEENPLSTSKNQENEQTLPLHA